MFTIGPPPTFHGKQIIVHFDPCIRDARIVAGGIRQLVRRFQNLHRSEDDLAAAIDRYVGDYCLATHLIRRMSNVIEFSVTLRPPLPLEPSELPRTRATAPGKVASPLR